MKDIYKTISVPVPVRQVENPVFFQNLCITVIIDVIRVCFQSSVFPSTTTTTTTTTSVSLSKVEDGNLGLHSPHLRRNNILPTSVPFPGPADNSVLHGDEDMTNNVIYEPRTFTPVRGVWKASDWGSVSTSALRKSLQHYYLVYFCV